MNELIWPEKRVMRKIKKRIGDVAFLQVVRDVVRYLEEGDAATPMGTRIKDLQNQYSFPQYRLRSGDYRVFYMVRHRPFLADRVEVIDIIHKKEWVWWLKNYGEKK